MKRQRQLNSPQEQLSQAAYGVSNPAPTESRSVTNILTGSHELTVVGYSLAKGMGAGKHIASDIFTVAGYRWAIYLYPDGKNPEDNSLYVSVFVALVSEGTDVRALFKLSLMDQSGKGKHKVQSHFDRPLESGPYTLKYSGSMWGYKRFLRRSLLDTSDFVKDDTLKICCTVGVVVSVTESPNSHHVAIPETNLSQQFGELMENEETADVMFDVAGEKFYAHRLVLAARSPVFKSQFFGSLQEQNNKEIFIGDMQPKVFKAMLHFIYRDTLPDMDEHIWSLPLTASPPCPSTSWSMAECLLAAADRFMLDRLKSLCEARIFQSISIDNVCTILSLAQCYLASQLKFECLKFAASNLEEVVQSEGFKYLKENRPSLQSELLETVARFEDDSGMIENSESTWSHDSDGFDSNSTEAQV